jgi:hypothetical protein
MPLELFIFQAVAGQNTLKAVAISQGMLFPFLEDELQLKKVNVGFKRCSENHYYEGSQCTKEHQEKFEPARHPVHFKEWLVIAGVYQVGPPQWACGRGRHAHYYAQTYCGQNPGPLRHGRQHDCCPLEDCPNFGTKHGQRGTTLWWRASFAGQDEQIVQANFWDVDG